VSLLLGRLCGADINPHGGGLGAGEADGRAVVVEVRATALLYRDLKNSFHIGNGPPALSHGPGPPLAATKPLDVLNPTLAL
jgi:hypothetical protein